MHLVLGWLDLLFGRGDDGFPFWLGVVRLNVLVFVGATSLSLFWKSQAVSPRLWLDDAHRRLLAGVLLLAAGLRLAVEHNITALGGIGYSRILLGYRGHFGTAQLYSLLYPWLGRDLEHAILFNRLASTLSVACVYGLCVQLAPATRAFAPLAALLLALHPLHLLFTPTDGLPISTTFLASASYLLLVHGLTGEGLSVRLRTTLLLAAGSGLSLMTQIRYENLVLLLPAIFFLWVRRYDLRWNIAWPAASASGCFLAVYAASSVASGPSRPGVVGLADGMRQAGNELLLNPIYALALFLFGTLAALLNPRSRVRWSAPLPLLTLLPVVGLAISLEAHDYSIGFVGLARPYVNLLLPMLLVAAYGLALLWHSPWRILRLPVLACVGWAGFLPVLFWPNLSSRYVEMAEHEFLDQALRQELPPGIDRLLVPDDELLFRESHSSIELLQKYRMITYAATAGRVRLVGVTEASEHPELAECGQGNCLFFAGLPCSRIRHYWFAKPQCEAWLARVGRPLRSEEVFAGSFLDCSLDFGATRDRACGRSASAHRLALYQIGKESGEEPP